MSNVLDFSTFKKAKELEDPDVVDLEVSVLQSHLLRKMNSKEDTVEEKAELDNWFIQNGLTEPIKTRLSMQLEIAALQWTLILNGVIKNDWDINFGLSAWYEKDADGDFYNWPCFRLGFKAAGGDSELFLGCTVYCFDMNGYDSALPNECFKLSLQSGVLTSDGIEKLVAEFDNTALLSVKYAQDAEDDVYLSAVTGIVEDDLFFYSKGLQMRLVNCDCVCEIEEVEVK